MKTTITLCLLIAICSLAVADTVRKDRLYRFSFFDVLAAQKNTQEKMQEILLMTAVDWQDVHLFLSIMQHGTNKTFNAKLEQELNNVRLAVQTTTEKGNYADYCIEDAENMLKKLRQDTESNINQCIGDSWKNFIQIYSVLADITKAGQKVLKDVRGIYSQCYMVVSTLSRCYAAAINRSRAHVNAFNKKLELHLVYRIHAWSQMNDTCIECLTALVKKAMSKLDRIRSISESCVDGAE